MKDELIKLVNSISDNIWVIPILLLISYFVWSRTINYQEPKKREINIFDRYFSGLNHLLMSNLRKLIFIDFVVIIISLFTMLILDSTINPNYDILPYFLLPFIFVIGLLGGGLLLMAKLSRR
jgi:hypothetical protein